MALADDAGLAVGAVSDAWDPYPFPEGFVEQVLALAAQGGDFLMAHADCLRPECFGRPGTPRRLIAEELLAHARVYGAAPGPDALEARVADRVAGRKPEERDAALALCRRVCGLAVPDAVFVTEKAVVWGRDQALTRFILRAADAVDPPAGARRPSDIGVIRRWLDEALRVGNNGNLGSATLDEALRRMVERTGWDPLRGKRVGTRFAWLNGKTKGGLLPGEVGVLLGPPKGGKSTLLIAGIGAAAVEGGKKVLHVSVGDLALASVEEAYDVALSGMTRGELRAEPRRGAGLVQRHRLVHGDLRCQFLPTEQASPEAIYALTTRLRAVGFVPDLIIVDFLSRMRGAEVGRDGVADKTATLARYCEDLVSVAREAKASIWTAASGTRGSFQKRFVTIRDFAWCFEIASIVWYVVAFCQTREERAAAPPRFRLFGAAGRDEYEDGGEAAYTFQRDRLWYEEAPLDAAVHEGAQQDD